MSFDTQIFEDKMNKSLENLKKDLNGLRTEELQYLYLNL